MHLQYTIFFDREKQAGGGNVKKPLPVRRGGVFGILCDEKPPFKQICLNGGLEQATGIYPQPEKQPTGLFFARCGVPACSIPRYACQRKKAATRRPFSLEQVTGIEPALSAWEAEVLPLHHTCTVDL